MIPKILGNMAAGYISILYKLRGPNHTCTTACATGANSIGDAYRMILFGDAKVMVAGASESAMDPVSFAGFCRAKALSTVGVSRPFDNRRDGFVMGEGAGILVLEEYEHAKNRGAKMYAEIKGYAMAGDAYHITSPSPDANAAIRVMKEVLRQAELSPEQIQYVNAHATSTPTGDRLEYHAIKQVFGTKHCTSGQFFVSSIKGSIGHLLGAAGAVEAIATILAIQKGIIPPTLNYEAIDEDLVNDPEKQIIVGSNTVQTPVRAAISNSFGFGGTNASLLFTAINE
jgi:3-oxoacyl-[acyl-carrier-protein] synthase II